MLYCCIEIISLRGEGAGRCAALLHGIILLREKGAGRCAVLLH